MQFAGTQIRSMTFSSSIWSTSSVHWPLNTSNIASAGWPSFSFNRALSASHKTQLSPQCKSSWFAKCSCQMSEVLRSALCKMCYTFQSSRTTLFSISVPRNLENCAILRLRCAFSESQDCVTHVRNLKIAYRNFQVGCPRPFGL